MLLSGFGLPFDLKPKVQVVNEFVKNDPFAKYKLDVGKKVVAPIRGVAYRKK